MPFVLSVYISEPGAFSEGDAEQLKRIVSQFKARLLLEERLQVLLDLSA